jgi:hypothetical protein
MLWRILSVSYHSIKRMNFSKIHQHQFSSHRSSMAMFRVSMFGASIVGFVGTTVGIVITLWRTRSKIRHRRSLSLLSSINKKDVEKLRLKHFAKSLTVSYANTGPLMIVEVRSQCYLRPCGFTLSPWVLIYARMGRVKARAWPIQTVCRTWIREIM